MSSAVAKVRGAGSALCLRSVPARREGKAAGDGSGSSPPSAGSRRARFSLAARSAGGRVLGLDQRAPGAPASPQGLRYWLPRGSQ